jgi:hypothetical protein
VRSNSVKNVLKIFKPCRITFDFRAVYSADSLSSYAIRNCLIKPLTLIALVAITVLTHESTCNSASPRRRLCTYQNYTYSVLSDLSTKSFACICINYNWNSDRFPLNFGKSDNRFFRRAISGNRALFPKNVVVAYDGSGVNLRIVSAVVMLVRFRSSIRCSSVRGCVDSVK